MQQREQRDADRSHEHSRGEDLLSRHQLETRGDPDQRADEKRGATLPHERLVEQQQCERRKDGERHVRVVLRLRERERAEAVEQAAHRSWHAPHVPAEGKVRAPRRESQRKRCEHVVGHDDPEQQRHRAEEERREKDRGVPHQVEPVRVVQVIADQWVVAVGEGERHPAQVPDEEDRIEVLADPAPRRVLPRRGEDGDGKRDVHRERCSGERDEAAHRSVAWPQWPTGVPGS